MGSGSPGKYFKPWWTQNKNKEEDTKYVRDPTIKLHPIEDNSNDEEFN